MIHFSTNQKRTVSLCNINRSREGFCHPDRVMEEYDLLYLKKGTWEIWEENTCYSLREGSLLILEPGLHHYGLEKCTTPMHNLFIHCSSLPGDYSARRPRASSCVANAGGTSKQTPAYEHAPAYEPPEASGHGYITVPKLTDCSGNPQIEQFFLKIMEAHLNKDSFSELRINALLELLFIELSTTSNEQYPTDSLVQEIIHSFYQHSDRFLSPQELAEAHHISIRSLSSRFKAATGTSIHRYQMDLKLNLAKEQLPLYPKRRLADVALSLGFYDEFHFSKLFKRKFGYSPSESYRQ